jgi:hypothetical protein
MRTQIRPQRTLANKEGALINATETATATWTDATAGPGKCPASRRDDAGEPAAETVTGTRKLSYAKGVAATSPAGMGAGATGERHSSGATGLRPGTLRERGLRPLRRSAGMRVRTDAW